MKAHRNPARTGHRRPLRIALSAALLTGTIALSPVSPFSASPASAADVWSAPDDLSTATGNSTLPQVSTNSAGDAVAVWLRATVDGTPAELCDVADQCVVESSRFDAGTDTWSAAEVLSSPTLSARQADVVISPTGGAMAIWRSTTPGTSDDTIQTALLTGTTWGAATTVTNPSTGSPRGPQISVSPTGEYTVVWYRSTFVESRQFSGGVWAPLLANGAEQLNLPAETAELARVVADGTGSVTALWQGVDSGTEEAFVRASRFDGANWSAAANVTPSGITFVDDLDPNVVSPFETLAPQLAVDPAGNATAVWQQTDGTNTRIMTSRSTDGTTWSAPQTLSAANGNALNPRADADADGNVTALWRRFNDEGFAIIQTARYDATAGTWGPVVDLSTSGRQSQGQRLAVDADGNVTAVWRRNNSDQQSIVQSARYSPDTNQWGAARDLSAPGQSAFSPSTDVDQAGNVIVVWSRVNEAGFSVIQASLSTSVPGFVTVTPARVFDTRPGESPDALRSVTKAKVGGIYELNVNMANLPSNPPTPGTGLAAVSLNVTVVDPEAAGFVTVYPCANRSEVSNVNFVAGQTVANAVITPVAADGGVCFFSNTPAHIVADINGYFPAGSGYSSVAPKRVFDTRPGESPNALLGGVKEKIGGTVELIVPMFNLEGGTTTPASGVSAVSLNVTVTNPEAAGFVTVYPCGTTRPFVSSVNFVAGQTVANAVIAPLSPSGQLCFFSNIDTDVIADINGWFPTSSGYAAAPSPARVLDTRPGESPNALRSVPKSQIGGTTELKVAMNNLTDVTPPLGVAAVALNVTVTNPAGAGFVTVYPCGATRPFVSSVNFVAGQTVANAVIVPVSVAGELCFFSNVPTDLVVDINGFFAV